MTFFFLYISFSGCYTLCSELYRLRFNSEHIHRLHCRISVQQAEEGKKSVAVQDRQGQHCLTSFISHLLTITPSTAKAKNLCSSAGLWTISLISSLNLFFSQFLYRRNLPNDPEVLDWASCLTIRAKRNEFTVQEMKSSHTVTRVIT